MEWFSHDCIATLLTTPPLKMKLRLKSKLPSSADAALHIPERFQHYDDDLLLARAVLNSEIKELTPWAFYSLGVYIISVINTEDKSMYDSPSILSILDRTYIFPPLILQQVISDAFTKWNEQIGQFYTSGCLSASSITGATMSPSPGGFPFGAPAPASAPAIKSSSTQCSRTPRSFDHTSLLYLSAMQKQVDPVKLMVPRIKDLTNKMADQSDKYHRKWCTKCINSLKEIATNIVLELNPHLVECAARLDHHDNAVTPSN